MLTNYGKWTDFLQKYIVHTVNMTYFQKTNFQWSAQHVGSNSNNFKYGVQITEWLLSDYSNVTLTRYLH